MSDESMGHHRFSNIFQPKIYPRKILTYYLAASFPRNPEKCVQKLINVCWTSDSNIQKNREE